MISFVRGEVIEKSADRVVVLVGGIGMEVLAPAGTIEKAPPVGKQVSLYTYLHVRQDVMQLFGFDSSRARELFIKLITVSGFGSQKALSVLSVFSPEGFEDVVKRGDAESLTIIPGVGMKSAQRLLLEMKDKLELPIGEPPGMPEELRAPFSEAIEALVNLGYSRIEAHGALSKYQPAGEKPSVEDMLQYALKNMGRV